ncbi:DNA-binding SARP family transcriptional activator [Thermocatellispora tengchongensis]|uniref:DNA-binding SARP family transcriptional activator n=1 Tax=Thermocatellispora tengchongensis TaxID=1073253 RepID=A0A840P464_9ACTN|nr:BTAD domain-containing putative transcriptional regulator [Thermocatellispora tengchongensis]MBB5132270.1 DNA-binding SARP family transcriptional activator [Thermocatellispora tengchongensis]
MTDPIPSHAGALRPHPEAVHPYAAAPGAKTATEGPEVPGASTLKLLGGFRLVLDGVPVTVSPRAQRLLTVLVCLGRHAPRSTVANTLWPDNLSTRAHANLRTILYRLQRVCPGLVLSTTRDLWLSPELHVDVEHSRAMAIELLNTRPGAEPALLERVHWTDFAEDMLPEWDTSWLADHQFCYQRLRLDALERLSDLLVQEQMYGAAVQAALMVVQTDPLRDTAHEALIRAYVAQGNRNDAISHYRAYRRQLRDELGLEPAMAVGQMLWSDAA